MGRHAERPYLSEASVKRIARFRAASFTDFPMYCASRAVSSIVLSP
jgi:hypothetical protein